MIPLLIFCLLIFSLSKNDFFSSLMFITLIEMMIYVISLSKIWYHVIMMIILLEFFSVKLFLLSTSMGLIFLSQFINFIILVLMVTEASIGMALVISMTRSWGDEALTI